MAEELEKNVAAVEEQSAETAAPKQRAKSGRHIRNGIVYVLATFNNTKVTITDLHGSVLCWSTGGKNGFKGFAPPFAHLILRIVEQGKNVGSHVQFDHLAVAVTQEPIRMVLYQI